MELVLVLAVVVVIAVVVLVTGGWCLLALAVFYSVSRKAVRLLTSASVSS